MKLLFLIACTIGTITAHVCTTAVEQAQEYIRKAQEHSNRNEFTTALHFYKKAAELDQENFNLAFEVANFLFVHGYNDEALTYYDRAANINPHVEQIYFNKGVIYNLLNLHEKAADCFLQAININQTYERAHLQAVQAFRSCKKLDQGIQIAKRSVKLINNNAELHYRYGLLLKDKKLYTKALKQFSKAAHLDHRNKLYLLELGNTLYVLDKFQEALYVFERLLELNPTDTHVLYNFGITLKTLGFVEQALKIYDLVIQLHPDFAPAQFSRALAYLTCGDFEHGLPGYEWRWKLGDLHKRFTNTALWTGAEDLYGKTLLIYAEQGLGDTLQFIRYAEVAGRMGARVLVETQSPLQDLLKLCPYIHAVYTRGQELPALDYQIPLLSMPLACGTTVDTIVNNVPYLHADPTLVSYWKEKLTSDTSIKIGICWQGNSNYTTPELRHAVAHKSVHPALFAPIARMQGVTLYSLQHNADEKQLQELPEGMIIHEFGQDIDTVNGRFMDTAAIMKNLDLIISIDTSICHLAGSLGIPVWTLLPYDADWRWLRHRSDTPWYSSMRLFKQPEHNDWQSVIQACCDALIPVLQHKKTVAQVTQEKGHAPEKAIPLATKISSYLPETLTQGTCMQEHIETTATVVDHQKKVRPFVHKQKVTFQTLMDKPAQQNIADEDRAENMAHALITVNKELAMLEQKLKALPELSPFDAITIDLFKACTKAYKKKCNLKHQLSTLSL